MTRNKRFLDGDADPVIFKKGIFTIADVVDEFL